MKLMLLLLWPLTPAAMAIFAPFAWYLWRNHPNGWMAPWLRYSAITFVVIYLVMLGAMFLAWCAATIGSWSPIAGLIAGISFITLYASTIAYQCSTHSSWYHRVMQRLEPKLHPPENT